MENKKVVKYHYNKHYFYREKNGAIDCWRLDYGYHNGPQCMMCGKSFCEHCHPDGFEEECSVGFYMCDNCNRKVEADYIFCPYCGEKFDESKEGD